jgi:hypothetical protein
VRLSYPLAWLDSDAFAAARVREHDAETAVGGAMKRAGLRDYYSKSQLAEGEVPNTPLGRKYLNSYSPIGSWFVMGVPDFYAVARQGHRRIALHLRHSWLASTACRFKLHHAPMPDHCRPGGHSRITVDVAPRLAVDAYSRKPCSAPYLSQGRSRP